MSVTAVVHAVDAFKNPSRYRPGRTKLAPDGMIDVIKIAAGDDATISRVSSELAEPLTVITEAARHYLLLQLLDPRVRGVLILGLKPGCSTDMAKEHKRWLLKWLHPDRNPCKWESSLFNKVSTFKLEDVALPVAIPQPLRPRGDRRSRDARHKKHMPSVAHQRMLHAVGSEPQAFNMRPLLKSLALTLCLLLSGYILISSGFFSVTTMSGWLK